MKKFIRQNFACATSFKNTYISAVLEAIKFNFKLWNDGSLGGMFIIGKIALYSAML